jgi:hypothetical protein
MKVDQVSSPARNLLLQKLLATGLIPVGFEDDDPILSQLFDAFRQADSQNRCLDAEIRRICAKFWVKDGRNLETNGE